MSTGKQRKILTAELRVEIGGRVEEYRKILGLGRAEFARLLEKNPADYSKYLDGRLDPQGLFVALRKAGCDLNWVADGNGPPPTPISGGPSLEYESEKEREEVEVEIDRIAKIVRLSSPSMTPVQARELRESLRKWAIRKYRSEQKEPAKSPRK